MARFWKGICCAMMLSLQVACGMLQPSATVPREHFDPGYLNDAAMAALAAGERGTATILLERAALLAPQDALVRENLAALRRGGGVRTWPAVPALPAQPTAPGTQNMPALPLPATATAPRLPTMAIWPRNDGVAVPAPTR